jgi:peptidoglycan/xylan/chitin deacetylase (PgdA/CDA1 family)
VTAHAGRFVLEFHGIAKQHYDEIPRHVQPSLTVYELNLIMGWLEKYVEFLKPREFLKSNKSGVLLTFDDGFANNCTNVMPILAQYEAPAIFFVSTQHILDPKDWLPATRARAKNYWSKGEEFPLDIAADFFDGMTQEQLRQCAQNPFITIGSHSLSHPFLTQCTEARVEYELKSSKDFLEKTTNKSVDLFAYPAGDYDLRIIQSVQSAGYSAAFAEDSRNVGFPAFEIPRIGIYSAHPAYLGAKLSGLHRRPIKRKLVG